jgi:cell division FtsZ-interacting protein ZapD
VATKIRKQIYLETRQERLVKKVAHQVGISEAEVIRQAIDQHLGSVTSAQPNFAAWEQEKRFINQVKQRPSMPGERHWQRNGLYER